VNHEQELAFESFVAAHGTALLRTAYLLTGHRQAAEDLLATALERTARRWPRVLDRERPEAYVRVVLTNLSTDRWRRLARRPVRPLTASDERRGIAPDLAAAAASRDLTSRLLRELPPRQRAVLVLRYFDDLPEADIAAALGCSVGTVKSQLSRGLARLRSSDHLSEEIRP